jgi:hypothetical protein
MALLLHVDFFVMQGKGGERIKGYKLLINQAMANPNMIVC